MEVDIIDCFGHATLKTIISKIVCRATKGDATNIDRVF